MSANLSIEEIISHLIFTERNIDDWEEYETNIIRNFKSINYRSYVSKDRMAEILYKNIVLNDNLFIELFKNGYYPRKECDFTGNDIWGLVEKCVHILVEKQITKKSMK
jgi:hypothetical protein